MFASGAGAVSTSVANPDMASPAGNSPAPGSLAPASLFHVIPEEEVDVSQPSMSQRVARKAGRAFSAAQGAAQTLSQAGRAAQTPAHSSPAGFAEAESRYRMLIMQQRGCQAQQLCVCLGVHVCILWRYG